MAEDGKLDHVINSLREQIQRGDFGTKGRLPSIAQLVRDLKVARTTMYQALSLLPSEGIVLMKGNAYYANYPVLRIPGAPLFDICGEQQGFKSTADNVIEPELVTLSAEIAALFGRAEGLQVVHRLRRHGMVDLPPIRLAEHWYPADLAGQFLEQMKEDPDLNVLGEIRNAHGVASQTRLDEILGRLPTSEEMKFLSLVRTSPVFEIRRQFIAPDGRVLLFNRTILVGAHFWLSYKDEKKLSEMEEASP